MSSPILKFVAVFYKKYRKIKKIPRNPSVSGEFLSAQTPHCAHAAKMSHIFRRLPCVLFERDQAASIAPTQSARFQGYHAARLRRRKADELHLFCLLVKSRRRSVLPKTRSWSPSWKT